MWYADWISGDEICKNDDKAPQYMKDDSNLWMFDNQDGCCNRFFSYKLSDCLGISDVSTNKYYPNWSKDDNGCKQDTVANPAPKYMKGSSVWLFDTLDACCDAHFAYDKANCKGESGTDAGTRMWYVDWDVEKCYMDCDISGNGPDCGGLAGSWIKGDLFDSQEECCSTKVSYDFRACMDI